MRKALFVGGMLGVFTWRFVVVLLLGLAFENVVCNVQGHVFL